MIKRETSLNQFLAEHAALIANRRAGRPRKDAERTPSGRISRAKPKEPADKLALEVRARMLNITKEQAKDQKAETFIGVLAIKGPQLDGLSDPQYKALQRYISLRSDMLRAIGAPNAGVSGEGPGTGGTEISENYVNWCKTVRADHAECKKAIYRAQEENRRENLWGALDLCVHQDKHMHHLVGSLRLVANALSNHFSA
jgi:hypothetical protein